MVSEKAEIMALLNDPKTGLVPQLDQLCEQIKSMRKELNYQSDRIQRLANSHPAHQYGQSGFSDMMRAWQRTTSPWTCQSE